MNLPEIGGTFVYNRDRISTNSPIKLKSGENSGNRMSQLYLRSAMGGTRSNAKGDNNSSVLIQRKKGKSKNRRNLPVSLSTASFFSQRDGFNQYQKSMGCMSTPNR